MRKIVEVAVGVLYGPHKKSVLISSRPQGKVCAGMWEFPGGKIESEETPAQALIRELAEELDVTCRSPVPWFVMEHEYPHAHVRLHFLRVFDFSGEPRCLEQQSFAWVNEKTLPQPQLLLPFFLHQIWYPIPKATSPTARTAMTTVTMVPVAESSKNCIRFLLF